ncbi:MAG: 50S ribosomal protein L3 [Cycloclasticus sp. symbiont of Poecilosclerida sp. N]|nr:MAG: 50S ribosomal protein L3 [Cycloclasticus sp. symbiont of Poecilosclerida sp. N]
MSLGLVGRKCGMTRLFTEEGVSIPVSVVHVEANRVTRVLNQVSDGYSAVQVTTGEVKNARVNKAKAGQFTKAGVDAGRGLWEFRLDADSELEVGSDVPLDLFEVGQKVDVRGQSIGKGFAGVIKRHNFQMQDATHGNSLSHRAPGSIGQCQTPGRVVKGKKMAGHMGAERVTTQNLEIVRVDAEKSVLLIKGAIPGSKNGDVVITPAIKINKQASL